MADRYTFKVRYYRCAECGERRDELAWDYDVIECCGQPMIETNKYSEPKSAAVIGDEIDITTSHIDGKERRFTSRAEYKRTLKEHGLINLVEHKPETRGSDKSSFTSRWI